MQPEIESVMLVSQSDLLVTVHPRHYCQTSKYNCDQALADCFPTIERTACGPQVGGNNANTRTVMIHGIPQPQFVPGSFPGEGLTLIPSKRGAGVTGGSRMATATEMGRHAPLQVSSFHVTCMYPPPHMACMHHSSIAQWAASVTMAYTYISTEFSTPGLQKTTPWHSI